MDNSDRLLEGLDGAQREAVTAPESLLTVIAGAGSGKTSVLTRRIAYRTATGLIDDQHTVAITFTRQAAAELRHRLDSLAGRSRVMSGTFHAVALALLRRRWEQVGRQAPTLLRSRPQLIREVIGNRSFSAVIVAAEIDWAASRAISPDDYERAASAAHREPGASLVAVGEVYREYATLKARRRQLDFDDLLIECTRELRQSAEFSAALRWQVRHLFVDEFQDVNPLQFQFLEALRQHRPDLTVVGDPNQAIYAWNGAEPELLEQIDQHFPGVRIVRLQRNYRSPASVVDAANAILETGGLTPTASSVTPGGRAVRYLELADEHDEVDAVASVVMERRDVVGTYGRIAVLARTNNQLLVLADKFRRLRIPAHLAGNRVTGDDEVAQLVDRSRTFVTEQALHAWSIDLLESEVAGEPTAPSRLVVSDAIRRFLDRSGISGRSDGDAFANWWAATAFREKPSDAIELLTFHAAKGREWPVVVVVGFEPGLLPHWSAKSKRLRDEETRLAYVACTRARDELVVTWARSREGRQTGPSVLLERRNLIVGPEPERPTRPRPGRRPIVDPVVESLLVWRRGLARVGAVDERLVLSDDVLNRLAELKPRSIDELAACHGIGPSTVSRHGATLLGAILRALPAPEPASPET